jgi:hypothetical protein
LLPSSTAGTTMTLIPEMQRTKFREVRKVQINIMRILTTQGLLNIYFNEMNSRKYENESVDREK